MTDKVFDTYDGLFAKQYFAILVPRAASRNIRHYFPSFLYHPIARHYESRIVRRRGMSPKSLEEIEQYHTLACLRHPVSRMISLYLAIRRGDDRAWRPFKRSYPHACDDFNQFVPILAVNQLDIHFASPATYIPENSFIIKLENLHDDLHAYQKAHPNITIDINGIVHFKAGELPKSHYIKETISNQSYDLIYEIYKKDFIRFNYEIDNF